MEFLFLSASIDLSPANLDAGILNSGVMYLLGNRDKVGNLLLVMECKKFVKGQSNMDEWKKIFLYFLERMERYYCLRPQLQLIVQSSMRYLYPALPSMIFCL